MKSISFPVSCRLNLWLPFDWTVPRNMPRLLRLGFNKHLPTSSSLWEISYHLSPTSMKSYKTFQVSLGRKDKAPLGLELPWVSGLINQIREQRYSSSCSHKELGSAQAAETWGWETSKQKPTCVCCFKNKYWEWFVKLQLKIERTSKNQAVYWTVKEKGLVACQSPSVTNLSHFILQ